MATYIGCDGAEQQNTALAYSTAGTITIDTTTTWKSGASFRMNLDNEQADLYYGSQVNAADYFDNVDTRPWGYSFHLYIATLPGAEKYLHFTAVNKLVGGVNMKARVDENGQVSMWSDFAGAYVNSDANISTGIWYAVHVRVYIPAGSFELDMYRADNSVQAFSTLARASGNRSFNGCYLGAVENSTGDMYFDNFIISGNSDGENCRDTVGDDWVVGILIPDGTGAHDDACWDNDWTFVDEIPPDDLVTTRSCATLANAFTETMEAMSALDPPGVATILGVQPVYHAGGDGGVGGRCELRFRSGGTDFDGNDHIPGAGWNEFFRYCMTDPDNGAWTEAAINACEVGCEKTDNNKLVRISTCYLMVAYLPHPAPTVTDCDPDTGPTAGGTSVTLAGTGFRDGATVTFDGDAADNIVVVDPTEITCDTPAHAKGLVDIIVTNDDTQSGTLENGFEYLAGNGGKSHAKRQLLGLI